MLLKILENQKKSHWKIEKVLEKSGKFVTLKKWQPCFLHTERLQKRHRKQLGIVNLYGNVSIKRKQTSNEIFWVSFAVAQYERTPIIIFPEYR